ncbi:hypothetical protein [Blastococcus brunescens]|uniref:Uncharacterized protein n=1 Tax=Blastococcus brunescens TaxID=1564165 RepID=A0ABZ1B2E7_9ACTN|nr:hypothetical protein [Blastococcus sp. BMG 8361]WRL63938.1 hypothetical protein U6N30_30775 [Blastococcus sp. BMG 8361]
MTRHPSARLLIAVLAAGLLPACGGGDVGVDERATGAGVSVEQETDDGSATSGGTDQDGGDQDGGDQDGGDQDDGSPADRAAIPTATTGMSRARATPEGPVTWPSSRRPA